ncbi:hypothetical protein SAMN04489764_3881 [Thermostaphylospora chromogena]|jgi:hypothetical protein|uniref:Uncharacterized protein n=2 Tax=Thermostaphylospora chromogena TaxID=35622 RepID=A0A1H1GXR8_9ACTN|nr:hypothetical protein SAMN04489764_3881 [Thermostaphylospora chromogena]
MSGAVSRPWAWRAYRGLMGRFLLIAGAVLVALFLLGPIIGLITSLLKWVLILGLIALAVAAVVKLTRDHV